MPKLKYKPRIHIPEAVRELKSLSPTILSEWVLERFNESRTPEAFTMWFDDHPDVKEELQKEIIEEELPLRAVRESIFRTGTFEKLKSVDKWAKDMRRRKVVNWKKHINCLKRVCLGVKPKMCMDKVKIGDKFLRVSYNVYIRVGYEKKDFKGVDLKEYGWSLKHPDRFKTETALEFIDLMIEHFNDVDISVERNTLRNFLRSKGEDIEQISGAKHKATGIYAKLFYPIETIHDILEYVKGINYEAYVLNSFMFKTGTRIEASLESRLENISIENGIAEIRVYDKGVRSKYPEGHPWDKFLPKDLLEEMRLISGYPERETGNVFSISKKEITAINWKALLKFVPDLWEKYPQFEKVNHFWRHMFAQHMLRKTDWRYGIVAQLGGWTMKALEESYGKPPKAIVREWGLKLIPEL